MGSTMDDLPPEMLTKILKCVDTRSLFECRLVSLHWNVISSGILSQRADNEIYFQFDPSTSIGFLNFDQSLKEFLECMKDCKNCPFAHFKFWIQIAKNPQDFFQHEDWIQFLSDFNPSDQTQKQKKNKGQNQNQTRQMKYLELDFHYFQTINSFNISMAKLKDLLTARLVHLTEFGLNFSSEIPPSEISLFQDQVQGQFPQLKKIQLSSSMFSKYPGITKDLLTRAVNLKSIHFFPGSSKLTSEVYILLRSLGKFQFLKTADIELNANFLSTIKTYPVPLEALKLEQLKVITSSLFKTPDPDPDPKILTDATNFLSALLESQKNTLKILALEPLGFLYDNNLNESLRLPTFKNLNSLEMSEYDNKPYYYHSRPFFPPGIPSLDLFTAVNSLNLNIGNWTVAFPQDDSIPRLPNVRNLSVEENRMSPAVVRKLALLCPYLANFYISHSKRVLFDDSPDLNFLLVGRSIWTEMTQLESFEIDLNLEVEENNSLALDSCFTGISVENCRRLFEVTEAKKTLEKWGFQAIVPESELETTREHPSILDMKELRKLVINLYENNKREVEAQYCVVKNKWTWISEEYAFKFLPHLKPKQNEENLFIRCY